MQTLCIGKCVLFDIQYNLFLNGNCSFFSPHLVVERIKLSILEDELLHHLHVDTSVIGFLHKAAENKCLILSIWKIK